MLSAEREKRIKRFEKTALEIRDDVQALGVSLDKLYELSKQYLPKTEEAEKLENVTFTPSSPRKSQ